MNKPLEDYSFQDMKDFKEQNRIAEAAMPQSYFEDKAKALRELEISAYACSFGVKKPRLIEKVRA